MDTLQNNHSEAQEKVDFFLVSTHELRTSLSAMKWMFQMLLDGDFGPLNDKQKEMIDQAIRANERMITLVNDTMTIIRTDGTSIPYDMQPLSLGTITDELIKEFTSEACHKGMHLRYTPPAEPIMIQGDIEKLRIVLHNLLENAIKYGASNSDISITLTAKETDAVLSIADRGLNIPDAEQDHIFQKFFRASNAKNEFVGVGLGLYATKSIVERHGGTISFESNPLRGTTFTVTFPLER